MTDLDEYIDNQWVDYPISRITQLDGLSFAAWLLKNAADEYQDLMGAGSIVAAQDDYASAIVLFDGVKDAENDLRAIIASTAQELLIEIITERQDCYDEALEIRLEGESFDKQRLM